MGKDDDEVVKGIDGVGVLQVEQKNKDIDVNENLEELDNEKKSIEGNFGNGEVDQAGLTKKSELCVGEVDQVGLTKKGELYIGDVTEVNSEVGGVDDSLKTPPPRRRGRPKENKGDGSINSKVKSELDKISGNELTSGISQRTRNRVVKGRVEDTDNTDTISIDMNGVEVDDDGVKESGFCLGNFVWGKVKSHPWWPGRVYSSSRASEFALKYKHEGRVLVAYFGDGTFAWCDPSQLKPFEVNFEEMSRQSGLKSFVSAVEKAVEEFGTVVEGNINMISTMNRGHTSLPLVVNAGIKEGVHVPLEGIEGFSFDKFEPTKILDNIRSFARFEFGVNLLEIRVLGSFLSVYYKSKGVLLSNYHEPMEIEEIIHIEEVSTYGPGDGDWLVGPGNQPSKKVKAITELLGLNRNNKFDENNVNGSKMGMQPRLLTSRSVRKRKVDSEDETVGPELDSDETGTSAEEYVQSSRGRRKKVDENPSHLAENLRVTQSSSKKGQDSEILNTSRSRGLRAKKDGKSREMSVGIRIEHVSSEEGHEQRMSPRERKRSKYLSPPYTSLLDSKPRNSDLEFSDVAKIGSPPLVKCSAETFQRSTRGAGRKTEADHHTRKLRSSVDDSVKKIGSSNDVLGEIRDASCDDGSNDPTSKEQTADKQKRKRKSKEVVNGSDGNVSDHKTPEKTMKKNERKSDSKVDATSLGGSLVIEFPPNFTLPSKEDLVKIYSPFGPLDESKLKVIPKSSSAKVVFIKRFDAETALNEVEKNNPFGTANVRYKIKEVRAVVDEAKKKTKTPSTKKPVSGVEEDEAKKKTKTPSTKKPVSGVEEGEAKKKTKTPSRKKPISGIGEDEVEKKTKTPSTKEPISGIGEDEVEKKTKTPSTKKPTSGVGDDEAKKKTRTPSKKKPISGVSEDEAKTKTKTPSTKKPTSGVSVDEAKTKTKTPSTKKPISGVGEDEAKKKTKMPSTKKPISGVAGDEAEKKTKMPSTKNAISEEEPLSVVVIKKKLEAMTSMLGKADGKMTSEVKNNLEHEAKELLKKVKMMKTTSPSS